ncbi:hypothetical protein BT96DRAFT_319263 [Gymnopus androsaceus JB14]|uniref:Uncharacterized protein n=1 Tax=Gymnopus androsaceus JB14 TaxID=1447944 RepID=A0A6A4H057_9AGAR|nr:hypothetical protein BT96DRAFT_319263 [Gymnopus androsaceus JB14]
MSLPDTLHIAKPQTSPNQVLLSIRIRIGVCYTKPLSPSKVYSPSTSSLVCFPRPLLTYFCGMSPEESELLASIGVSLYWDTAQEILNSSLFGFYVLLNIIALKLLFKTGIKSSRPRQVLLSLTILVFVVNIWAFIN